MVKPMSMLKRAKTRAGAKRRRKPEVIDEEERILREATKYLVFQEGMFLVATGLREARIRGFRVWIITVTMRLDAGDETYIGDLLYDGKEFTLLTEQSVMDERAQKLLDDPESIRKWNEYRASTLRAGKALPAPWLVCGWSLLPMGGKSHSSGEKRGILMSYAGDGSGGASGGLMRVKTSSI